MTESETQDNPSSQIIEEGLESRFEKLARHLESVNFQAYADLLQRPLKLLALNFLAGIARGFGIAVGMGTVVALVGFILAQMLPRIFSIPLLGQYIAELVKAVQVYMPTTPPPPGIH